MSRSQTLSPGGEPQLGRPRFSSPLTALVVVAHDGTHPIHLFPPPMVAEVIPAGKGFSRGRCPVSRFPWMEKCVKLLRSLTHNGNSPDSWLFARNSRVRLGRFPSSGGIGPVRLLPLSRNHVRLARFPSSGGIGPVRLLPLSHSCWRLGRFPSSGGSLPFSLLLVKLTSPTRLLMKPTPIQVDIAVVAFQLRVAVPRRVSLSPQRTLQSATRPVFV